MSVFLVLDALSHFSPLKKGIIKSLKFMCKKYVFSRNDTFMSIEKTSLYYYSNFLDFQHSFFLFYII